MMLRRIARSFCTVARHAAVTPLLVALIALPGACDKPKEKECRKAIDNIRKIYGTDDNSFGVSPEAMVRSCQGSTSPESVQCFIRATSVEDLQKCEGGAFGEMFGSQDDVKADKKEEGAKKEGVQDEAAKDEGAKDEAGQGEGAKDEAGQGEGANAEGTNAEAQGEGQAGQAPAQ